MDKTYDKFAEALEKIVNDPAGGTWQEKYERLKSAMEERSADGALEEILGWGAAC